MSSNDNMFYIGNDEKQSNIPFEYLSTYQALAHGFLTGQTMLVKCEDRKSKEPKYAICICGAGEKVMTIVPLALLSNKNLSETLRPPDYIKEGGGVGFN